MNAQMKPAFRPAQRRLATVLLSVVWVLAVTGAAGGIFFEGPGWDVLVGLTSFVFILGLTWALSRAKPAVMDLPEVEISAVKRTGFWVRTLLLFLGLGLAFFLGMIISFGFSMMLVCGLSGLGVTLAWRRMMTWKIAGTGLAAGAISALSKVFLGDGDLSFAIALLVTIPPAFTAGALLLRWTQLGHVRVLEGKPGLGVKGFLVGCVLALPPALLNVLGNIQSQDTWLSHWWQAFHAIQPAIAEETWARLFLVSFCYAVLRPVTNHKPRRAIVVATLISVLGWGFAHEGGINPIGLFIGALLYGLPEVLLLIKKDFEHAVGYHFLIDFVRYGMAFLS